MALDAELTTRPVAGVDWALGTAFVYNKQRHPKTIPVLARHLKKRLAAVAAHTHSPTAINVPRANNGAPKRPPQAKGRYNCRCPAESHFGGALVR